MPIYDISDGNALYYEYTKATAPDRTKAGHGVLVYNMRGQLDSPFSAGTDLDQALIVDDAKQLLNFLAPSNPVFVGLSIGGIFAAWAVLEGVECAGMVFINTLRRDGPRLQWINDAVVRLFETGGGDLLRDVLSPLIMNEQWQETNREHCLGNDAYSPIDRSSGTYNLLSNARNTDWNFPYEKLTMPVLSITGVQDRVFRDPIDIDAIFARLPDARRIDLQHAGHMIPVEQPQALLDALLEMVDWLNKI